MRASKFIFLILAIMVGLFGLGYSQEPPKMALSSESKAIARAVAYTGFDELNSYDKGMESITARLERIEQVKIPFLWRDFVDQEIWVVTIPNIVLEDARFRDKLRYDSVARTFTAYLDPKSGVLLRLESKMRLADSGGFNPEPPVEMIEEQLSANERFIGFPQELVKVSFVEALAKTNNPWFDAKEIIAYCVNYTTNGWWDTLDVWSIDFRGFPLDKWLGPHTEHIDEYARGHERNVINAQTGRLYMAGSLPMIIPPEVLEKYGKTTPSRSDQSILQDHDVDSIEYARPLETAEEALQAADLYTGFDQVDSAGERKLPSVGTVPIDSLEIPFLTDETRAGEAWMVRYASIPVGQQTRLVRNRDFSVFLDKRTGKLLMIYSIADDAGSSDTMPQLTAKEAEASFGKCNTSFRQLPDQLPKVPFWESLKSVIISNPAGCKIIKAYYWDFDVETAHYLHCWRVIMRGLESPLLSSHGGTYGNNMEMGVNGDTGAPLFGTTVTND